MLFDRRAPKAQARPVPMRDHHNVIKLCMTIDIRDCFIIKYLVFSYFMNWGN